MAKQYKIYGLVDPVSQEIRYIGYTSKSLNERLKCHVYDARRGKSHKRNWITSLVESGNMPEITLICDCVDLADALKKEVHHISLYQNLTNSTTGGEVSKSVLSYVKVKMSIARTGKLLGRQNPMYGKKRSDLSLRNKTTNPIAQAKTAAKLKQMYNTEKYRVILRDSQVCKSVIQKTLSGEVVNTFASLREAALSGFGRKEIMLVSKGKYKQHKGYLWEVTNG